MCDELVLKNFACVINGVERFCMCDEPVLKNFAFVINRCGRILHVQFVSEVTQCGTLQGTRTNELLQSA